MITPTSGAHFSLDSLGQRGGDRLRGLAQVLLLLVVVGQAVEDQDRLALRGAVLQADDREPPHGHVRIVGGELVQHRAHAVHIARMVAGEAFERDQRRPPRGRALVLEPAPDQLELLAEPELRDRAVGVRADAVVGAPRRMLQLLVPLLPQRREPTLVSLLRELVGLRRGLLEGHEPEIDEAGRGPGPTYFADGRTRRFSFFCSRMCADQPAVREQANIAGASCGGTSATSRTTADQNSTFVSSGRSGDFFRSAASAACLELLRHLVPRCAELLGRALEQAGARILGAVDAVAEAHQPLALLDQALDVGLRIARLGGRIEHRQHPRRRAAVERAGERADRRRERRGAVGAGRRRDPRDEGRGVEAVLAGADPVGVDRLNVLRVGLAAPLEQEALGGRLSLSDDLRVQCGRRSRRRGAPTALRSR